MGTKYPVIIVGGGINGVGIARDCALRGISCLLVEKLDFGSGTSGASSGMIHGGPRYMLSDIDVTRLACLDSGFIQKIAPHLLFRIPFLYTVYETEQRSHTKARLHLAAVESFFAAYDRFVSLKNGKKHTRLKASEIVALEPNVPKQGLIGGVTFDEWGIDVPRLCVANAVDAKENGAHLLNHTQVMAVIKEQNRVVGVRLKNLLTGLENEFFCDVLINSTGPWSPQFAKLFGVLVRVRGGKGIHVVFDRKLFNIALISQAIDGREIFFLPYENVSVLGTTDDDYFGDLDGQKCTSEEIAYLLEGIERVFPAVKSARMISSLSGVRPTIYARDCHEDDLSREHEIIDHEKTDHIAGAISLIGGKLASYRIIAKEVTDVLCHKLGLGDSPMQKESQTDVKFLPGGENIPDVGELSRQYSLDAYTVSRLVYRHGSRAVRILDMVRQNPELGAIICPCEPVTEAEIRYVVQNEMAQTLSDVRRRTRLTVGPCQGRDCLIPAASILSTLESGDEAEPFSMISTFTHEWWYNRAIVLRGEQLKQEELAQALFYGNGGISV